MNAIDTTSPTDSSTPAATTRNGFSDLNSEQFIKIIFTELSKQDPLQPNDSSKLLEQLSSIRSIQADIDMGKRLDSIVTQNQLSAAAGMIGRNVTGLNDRNERVSGTVASVSQTKSGPVLRLGTGERLPLAGIDEIVAPTTDGDRS
jgi:flagellar basal-body rod modification protein FlgD